MLAFAASAHAQGAWQPRQAAGMNVQVYTPAAGQAGARGLLIALHGCTQSAEAMRQRAGLERAAEDQGVVIATPAVPNGGVILGCWDYYGANHTRRTRHVAPLLGLVDALLADGALGIDPGKVWIAGLSSGGGQAVIMGCVAPDVFAGVGVAAGPAVGTSSAEIGRVATDVAQATRDCRQLAGGTAGAFDTQLFAVVAGRNDFTVAQGYAAVNAGMAAALYGAQGPGEAPLATVPGVGVGGRLTEWRDAAGPRVWRLEADGLGHAWPAGGGQGQELEFVAQQGPDFGLFLARMFTQHGRRVRAAPAQPAQVVWVAAEAQPQQGAVAVSGQVAGPAADVAVSLRGAAGILGPRVVVPGADQRFAVLFPNVARGTPWTPVAVARDGAGVESAAVEGAPVILRDPANDQPPWVQLAAVESVSGCVEARGTSGDDEDGVPAVALVARGEGGAGPLEALATVGDDGGWSARLCGLGAGCWTVFAVATDRAGLAARSAPQVVGVGDGGAVEVVEANLNGHLMRYGTYGLGYGTPDITYVDLLARYGLNEVFPLYLGVDGRWYHDPANLPGAAPPDCEAAPVEDMGLPVDLGAPADLGAADMGPDRGPDPDEGVGYDPAPASDAAPPAEDLGQDGRAPDLALRDRGEPDAAAPRDAGDPDQAPPRTDAGTIPPAAGGGDVIIDCTQAPGGDALLWWGLLGVAGLRRRRRRA